MGLAKKSFLKSSSQTPWLSRPPQKKTDWPFVEYLLAKEQLAYLDYRIAQCVFNSHPVGENAALFLCHLVMAAREGHLCALISEDDLSPSVDQLWPCEGDESLTIEEIELLTKKIVKGAQEVPPALITLVQTQTSFPATSLCRFQNYYYLQKNWIYESVFLEHFKSHLEASPSIQPDESSLKEELAQLENSGALLKEQSTAILKGALSPFSIIFYCTAIAPRTDF